MDPGKYDLTGLRRGDSVPPADLATLTYAQGGAPIALASARLQIRDRREALVHEWSTALGTLEIAGEGRNIVRRALTPGAITQAWAPGGHVYDLEVVTASGETWTVLEGSAPIAADCTR